MFFGDCGMTFRTQDVCDLQHKLQLLLDHPALVYECATRARARVRRLYSWESVVDRLETIYAGGRPAPVPEEASSVAH